MNLPIGQAVSPGGDNNAGVACNSAASAHPHYTVGEVGFGRSWQDEEPGLRALYEEAQAQIAIYEVERGILEKEMRRLREDVAKYRATRLTHEDEQILAKGHQGHAKAAVTEGGTGYSGAERPEPSPQFPETQEAIERWRQGKINIFDEMARLERERNELREVMAEIVTWVEDDLRETVDAGYRAAVEKAQKLTEGLR